MSTSDSARLQSLFAAALELPPEKRDAFLQRECADAPALLAQLRGLLVADEQLAGTTARSAVSGIEDLIAQAGGKNAAHGIRVGHFVLREELGHGGMGRVYRAERVDGDVEQQVAIKFVRRELLDANTLQRFQLERRLLAGLNHPNIARLFDADQLADGTPYYVMEFIDGVPIDQYCKRAPLNLRQRIELIRTVCGAVIESHHNLVVHRDLKPSNILVAANGVPKLLDFGIAKPIDGIADNALAQQTGTQQRYFSPQYAAPEQILGNPVGVACDVYGLGLLLHELLADSRPFDFSGLSAGQVERMICEQPPAAPSVAASRMDSSVASRAKALRGDLDGIVTRCLRKAPAERYASVEQLRDDLDNYLEGRPVVARGGHTAYRLRKFVGRNRLAVAVAASVVVMVVGFVATLSTQLRNVQIERDSARQERDRADQVAQFLTDVFKSADPKASLSPDAPVSVVLQNGRNRLMSQLGDAPAQRRRLLILLADVYMNLDDDKSAEKLLEEAKPLVLDAASQDLRVSADYYEGLAHLQERQGLYAEGLVSARQALAAHRTLGDSVAKYVNAADIEAIVSAEVDSRVTTAKMLRKLVDDYQADPLAEQNVLAGLELKLVLYMDDATVEDRENLARKALARLEAAPHHDELALADGRVYLAGIIDDGRNRPADALPLLHQALEKQTALLGPRSRSVATTLNCIGISLQHLNRFDEALLNFEQAQSIYRELHKTAHPDLMAIAFNIGSLEEDRGNFSAAADSYLAALKVIESVAPPHSTNTASARAAVGRMRLREGKLVEAEALLGTAVQDIGFETGRVISLAIPYAETLWRLKKIDQAREVLEKIKPWAEKSKGDFPGTYKQWEEMNEKVSGNSNL